MAREKEEQLSAAQSEVERLQVLLREAHEGGAGPAPDAPTAQELAEELNAARGRATAAEEELAEAKRHVASARDEDTLIRTRAAQVEERLAATASRIEHLEARLAQSGEEVRAAHARADQAEGWARQLQTDLQDARETLEQFRERCEHRWNECSPGRLAELSREAYEVVLLDIWMPGIDGLLTLSRIQELPASSRPAAVMISSAVTAVARLPFFSPEPCVAVMQAPAIEMCGREARL